MKLTTAQAQDLIHFSNTAFGQSTDDLTLCVNQPAQLAQSQQSHVSEAT